jgi:hypothetical protein
MENLSKEKHKIKVDKETRAIEFKRKLTSEMMEVPNLEKLLKQLGILKNKHIKLIWMRDDTQQHSDPICHCHILEVRPILEGKYLIKFIDDENKIRSDIAFNGDFGIDIIYDSNTSMFSLVRLGDENLMRLIPENQTQTSLVFLNHLVNQINQTIEYHDEYPQFTSLITGNDKEIARQLFDWKLKFKEQHKTEAIKHKKKKIFRR